MKEGDKLNANEYREVLKTNLAHLEEAGKKAQAQLAEIANEYQRTLGELRLLNKISPEPAPMPKADEEKEKTETKTKPGAEIKPFSPAPEKKKAGGA